MTAADGFQRDQQIAAGTSTIDESSGQSIELICRMLIDGRRAGRMLADWLHETGLGEPEFLVLWCLRDLSDGVLDQTTLASRLAYSAAQVSATVERLGGRGWISQVSRLGDRRRHVWQLSAKGRMLLESILSGPARLLDASAGTQTSTVASASRPEAAA